MCCIEPSIKQSIPGMPNGKPAKQYCINLNPDSLRCLIWGQENYPDFCRNYTPEVEFCGQTSNQALQILRFLEDSTVPPMTKQ